MSEESGIIFWQISCFPLSQYEVYTFSLSMADISYKVRIDCRINALSKFIMNSAP